MMGFLFPPSLSSYKSVPAVQQSDTRGVSAILCPSPAPFHVLHADLRRSFMKGYRSPSPIFRLYEGIYEDAQKFFPKKKAVDKMDILSTA
ncbi:MAG TPA: hypothetical protein DDW60_05580 [Kandleria vitulina]|nr:hypothetical protein [Kandleria vitulina]